jgi:hypothetical protein
MWPTFESALAASLRESLELAGNVELDSTRVRT